MRAILCAQEFIKEPTAIVFGPCGISLHVVPQWYIDNLTTSAVDKVMANYKKEAFLHG